jgi:hypothetical protein
LDRGACEKINLHRNGRKQKKGKWQKNDQNSWKTAKKWEKEQNGGKQDTVEWRRPGKSIVKEKSR